MKLLEIKNNLVKLSYENNESPILGRFIVLMAEEKNYVAQFVNLKADTVSSYAIAKLIFTFTSDGVVDNYDGSIPNMESQLLELNAEELLNLLPVETPIKIGSLAQQQDILNLDISIFEHNLTVFAERETDKTTFISNCVRQLFQQKEKSVIIDTLNNFADYPRIEFTKDFKLPLNSELIDYLFEHELIEVDTRIRAVIQDIFYAVQQYIKTLDFEFLPIDNFVDVVASQYKETQMPELALLKNKLLKYRDANIFANTKEEVLSFAEKISQKNCSIVSINDINDSLQKEVIIFIHKALQTLDKYIYLFCSLNDENSDKKLLKQIINNNHVFTTLLVSNSYKYARDLKAFADNIILFAPQDMQHDFAAYNTFLNKLNIGECIVFGKLTQGIPFIIDMNDLQLDLTKDDVLGDKYTFVPVPENVEMLPTEDVELSNTLENTIIPEQAKEPPTETVELNSFEAENFAMTEDKEEVEYIEPVQEYVEESEEVPVATAAEEYTEPDEDEIVNFSDIQKQQENNEVSIKSEIIEPVGNIFEDNEPLEDFPELSTFEDFNEDDVNAAATDLTEDDLDFIEDNRTINPSYEDEIDTLDMAEDTYIEEPYIQEEASQVVPVYPANEHSSISQDGDEIDFAQGDSVTHPRYGRGVVEKIIKYGNKTLCSISFENVGRRLLDPSISEFTKL